MRRRKRVGLVPRAGAVFVVFAFLMSMGIAGYASAPNGNGNPGHANSAPNGKGNPDSNGKGPDRSPSEDGDHNQGGRCDGNEGHNADCQAPGGTSVIDPAAPGNGNNGNGNGNGNGNNGNGNGTNPDCNGKGPERHCGEEDGDHNQGGPCDGNEGKRPHVDCDEGGGGVPDSGVVVLDKSGPREAAVGDTITYTFEVANTGKAAITHVELKDPMLGLTRQITHPLTPPGTPNDSAKVSATFKVPASAGHSLLNTAQVCGQSQGKTVCDSDTHVVKIPGQPGIDIAKSVSQASANPGDTLTFTYDVTNVGDTKLTNVTVDDDVLGKLLDGHSLEPGESVTFTTDFEVANDSPTRNVATACGEDPDGTKICDTAAVTFELTLPSGPQQAGGPQGGPAGTLPRTGFSLLLWLAGGLNLIATGLAMMFRRRWPTA